jgi:carbonyl reductase 1
MKVAIVTGSNKGIGLAIVKKLCQQFDGVVYLTARNVELGQKAVSDLKSELSNNMSCAELRFHQLDISNADTIKTLKDHIVKEHGGLDILVNNAAIAYKMSSTAPFAEQAEETMKINYFGTKSVCDILFPILKPHARVVNVSSQAGLLKQITSEELKSKFLSPVLTAEELSNLLTQFVEYAKSGTHQQHGYSNSAYGMSKVGVTALTRIQQACFDKSDKPDIIVNACCPGYVNTDMTSHNGHLEPQQGAETPVYLALLPENATRPKGAFVYLKKETNWITGEPLSI